MSVNRRIAESLEKLTFEHRESGYRHHTYEEDMEKYALMKRGDPRAMVVARQMFEGPLTGSLSDDPVRNYQYLFVASITMACRFCIEGGMASEEAFNLSDLYIRQVDKCQTKEEIFALHGTMFSDCVTRMQRILRRDAYSRPVVQCLNHIDLHLQEPLTLKSLAEALSLSESYLSVIFKREMGVAVSEYIRAKRVETARTLLQYTEFSCLEIAEYLCFSSDSHFSRVFKAYTGQTPTEYRNAHFQRHWDGVEGKA